ncbi:Response regulator receiver domain-containing protein [Bacillus toyonensis]|uniref:response regulator n=1 Tax=Bacillus toyonensis TaxID=155322 RepID=UPI000890DA8B|nr:response regulator [Bacillus toyonensis]SDK32112.1 Response regulator receiver domain-containing protein [Bacillus toyonensis]
MQILIIEDDMNKSSKIENFLRQEINNISIDTAISYNSGLRKIISNEYNLILLDMTMPTFDKTPSSHGGKLIRYAGKEILGQMKRKKIFTPTIVITQYATFGEEHSLKSFDEMKKELFEEYSQFLISMIYFEPDKSDWEMNIISLIKDR